MLVFPVAGGVDSLAREDLAFALAVILLGLFSCLVGFLDDLQVRFLHVGRLGNGAEIVYQAVFLLVVVGPAEQGAHHAKLIGMAVEDSLKVFEEGVALARRCSKYLEEAEKRIELLTKDEGGLLRTEPFEWDKDAQG